MGTNVIRGIREKNYTYFCLIKYFCYWFLLCGKYRIFSPWKNLFSSHLDGDMQKAVSLNVPIIHAALDYYCYHSNGQIYFLFLGFYSVVMSPSILCFYPYLLSSWGKSELNWTKNHPDEISGALSLWLGVTSRYRFTSQKATVSLQRLLCMDIITISLF